MEAENLLTHIPDFGAMDDAQKWISSGLTRLAGWTFDEQTLDTFTPVAAPDRSSFDKVLGCYGSSLWRRFALAVFFADWACYDKPADRAEFSRILYVLSCFPEGFRVWMCCLPGEGWLPVGYTGWYPIPQSVYEIMRDSPSTITNRGFMGPLNALRPSGNYLYLFNASVIPQLKGKRQGYALMRRYKTVVTAVAASGVASVSVSRDGQEASKRLFDLVRAGDMNFAGEPEAVFVSKVTPPSPAAA